jgi:hypothetical protein
LFSHLNHDFVAVNSIWQLELHFIVGRDGFALRVSTLRVVGVGRKTIELVADKVEKIIGVVEAVLVRIFPKAACRELHWLVVRIS